MPFLLRGGHNPGAPLFDRVAADVNATIAIHQHQVQVVREFGMAAPARHGQIDGGIFEQQRFDVRLDARIGHTLLHARELCDDGGWLRWLRKNFDGSVRTAQRYMRVARQVPASKVNATSVSPKSQVAVLRAIRGVVFTGSGDTVAGAPCVAGPTAACDADPAAHRRLAFVAARRLRKLAGWLVATAAGAPAAVLAERINALATDFLFDVGGASTSGEVYFIEAVGAERVKIGVSGDVDKRFNQLAASFPGPLRLLGKAPGGRAREGSLHRRLANFHIGGEWFHLTPGVRAVIEAVIADDAE